VIPRPATAEPGGAPPWTPRRGITLEAVLDALRRAGRSLTRRSARLRTHRGQVSFPGGRLEPGEEAVGAALREAREEVGLDPAAVRPVGYLARAFAFSSGAPITPVVAALAARPTLSPNPAEVDRAFDASLADLAAAFSEEWWSEPGLSRFPMYFFSVEGETIWGATARMIVDLLTTVLTEKTPGR